MEPRNLGLLRALGWERTPGGVEFRCVTELLAAARVAVEVAGPHAVRVRITAGAVPVDKAFSYVVGRPETGPWTVEAAEGRVIVRLYNPTGREREARIRLRGGVRAAWRTNILEALGESLPVGADGVRLILPPGRILTLALEPG